MTALGGKSIHEIKGKWHFSSKYVSQDYILTILGLNSLGLDRFLVQGPSVVEIIIICSDLGTRQVLFTNTERHGTAEIFMQKK